MKNLQNCILQQELNCLSTLTNKQNHSNSEQFNPENDMYLKIQSKIRYQGSTSPFYCSLLLEKRMLPRENVKLRGMYLESWTISNLFLVEQKAQIANKPSVPLFKKDFIILYRIVYPLLCHHIVNKILRKLYIKQCFQLQQKTCLFQSTPNRYLRYFIQVLCSWRIISQF